MSSDALYGDSKTRQRILAVTQEVIAERGAAMSVKDVGERAGVSRQTVYLHFGDRAGLVLALVRHMDEVLALGAIVEGILAAEDGADVIDAAVRAHVPFNEAIDSIALVLESTQYEDKALGEAWRDRMRYRHGAHVAFVQRIADLGELADGWSVAEAADLFYAATMIAPWRELTAELGWSQEQYVDRVAALLKRALLA